MSSSFVGGSSDSRYGSSSSGSSGGGSALTQTILSSVSLAAENVALSLNQPALNTRPQYAPVMAPTTVSSLGASGLGKWLAILVIAFIGIFAYKKL